ncbi:MAG: hypothetical protein ACK44M_12955 [Chloroflexus sp.]
MNVSLCGEQAAVGGSAQVTLRAPEICRLHTATTVTLLIEKT